MESLEDVDDPTFRRKLDQATIAASPFHLPDIADVVTDLAVLHGRVIRCLRVARRSASRDDPARPGVNCHAYALGLHATQAFREINKSPESDFVTSLIESGLLVPQTCEDVREGDVVPYRSDQRITHSGIALRFEIESKWGEGSIFRHSLFAVPLNYGSAISFHRSPELAAIESAYRVWFFALAAR